jgi:hypothetical protein
LLVPEGTSASEAEVGRLARLQQRLGRLHDQEMLAEWLKGARIDAALESERKALVRRNRRLRRRLVSEIAETGWAEIERSLRLPTDISAGTEPLA